MIMKKLYVTPKTELAILSLNANMLAGSDHFEMPVAGGLEQDQNDDGGSCAKGNGFWWFEEESTSADTKHVSAWESFQY